MLPRKARGPEVGDLWQGLLFWLFKGGFKVSSGILDW